MHLFLKGVLLALVIVAGVFVGMLAAPQALVAPSETIPVALSESKEATSTLEKPAEEKPPLTPQTPKPAAPQPDLTEIEEAVTTLAKKVAEAQVQVKVTAPPATQTTNETVRSALANIICMTEAGGSLNPISASGVFIHPSGVIITNAHVGQYFLLKDYPHKNATTCTIRTGSPAQPKYTAELLFLPPSWIENNAEKVDDETPTGNGEYDYALLRVTGTVSPSIILPPTFPSLLVALDPPKGGAQVLVAGYAAGFLGGITIAKELYSASSIALIGQIFTFTENTPDLFSIGGSVVAQQGSSGGAVAYGDGTLVGVITTSSDGATTAARDLRAIATSYIALNFQKEGGKTLESFLNGNLATEAEAFNITTAPALTKKLTDVLEK